MSVKGLYYLWAVTLVLGYMVLGAYIAINVLEVNASAEMSRAQSVASIIGAGAPVTHAYCVVYHPNTLISCIVDQLKLEERLLENLNRQAPGQAL